jgi:hypothetical protein
MRQTPGECGSASDVDPENCWAAGDGQIVKCLRAHGTMKVGTLCDERHLRLRPSWPCSRVKVG